MGLWDFIRKLPVEPPCTPDGPPRPEIEVYSLDGERKTLPRTKTIGQVIDEAKDAIKFIRNARRRIASLFDDEESQKLKKGDVIGVCRGVYDHYGVYESDDCVIHYSSKNSDTSSDNSIIITSLNEFARGDGTIFKLIFPDQYDKPTMVVAKPQSSSFRQMDEYFKLAAKVKRLDYKLYSPDETVERAKTRVGEKQYSLKNNNCEHFAIWCKTGISESHQINALLELQRNVFREIFNPGPIY